MMAARRAFETGHVTSTEQICKQVLAFAPERSDVWALLSETALRRNRLDAAIVCADRAAALDPKEPIVHILRAKCRFFSGDAGEAVEAAEQAPRDGTVGADVPAPRARGYRNFYSTLPPPNACWGSSKPPNSTAMTRSR